MYNVSRKCVERNLRAKNEALSNLKKAFFEVSYWTLAVPGYENFKKKAFLTEQSFTGRTNISTCKQNVVYL